VDGRSILHPLWLITMAFRQLQSIQVSLKFPGWTTSL
jgi:hypothetical protein